MFTIHRKQVVHGIKGILLYGDVKWCVPACILCIHICTQTDQKGKKHQQMKMNQQNNG